MEAGKAQMQMHGKTSAGRVSSELRYSTLSIRIPVEKLKNIRLSDNPVRIQQIKRIQENRRDYIRRSSRPQTLPGGNYQPAYKNAAEAEIHEMKTAFAKELKTTGKRQQRLFRTEFFHAFRAETQKIEGKEKAQKDVQKQMTYEEIMAKSARSSRRIAALPFSIPIRYYTEKMMTQMIAAIVSVISSVVSAVLPIVAIVAAIVGVLTFLIGFIGTLAASWDPATDGLPDAHYVINTAVQWAEYIAANDRHGYNDGYFSRWGPDDYSNITFIVTAYDNAGLSLKKDGASRADDLYDACINNGFLNVKDDISSSRDLEKGDLLIRKGRNSGDYFLAIYCGDQKMVRALYDERGRQKHGEKGDQTGEEIAVQAYSNMGWDYILRYYGDMTLFGGVGSELVKYAMSFIGKLPYVWGGTSLTSGADCSGFVQAVYAHYGYSIPRTAGNQYAAARKVSNNINDWQPGDIIYYSKTGTVQTDGGAREHITIYAGNGKCVGESSTRYGCILHDWNYRSDYYGTARILPDFDSTELLVGNDNATKIWNYLRKTLGCSRAAAAGIMGNIYAESEFNANCIETNGVGHGIFQWSWERWDGRDGLKRFAYMNHKDWSSLATQLAFFKYEAVQHNSLKAYYPGGWQKYKALTSVDGDGGSSHVFFYAFEYGSYITYEKFTSAEFEKNFACTSKRLGIAKSVYRNTKTYP